jgi:hypothetical protein
MLHIGVAHTNRSVSRRSCFRRSEDVGEHGRKVGCFVVVGDMDIVGVESREDWHRLFNVMEENDEIQSLHL